MSDIYVDFLWGHQVSGQRDLWGCINWRLYFDISWEYSGVGYYGIMI